MLTAWLFFCIWVKLLLLVITQQAKKPHGSWACACQVGLAVLFPSSPSSPSSSFQPHSHFSVPLFLSFLLRFLVSTPLPFLRLFFFAFFFSHLIVFLAFRKKLGEELTLSIVALCSWHGQELAWRKGVFWYRERAAFLVTEYEILLQFLYRCCWFYYCSLNGSAIFLVIASMGTIGMRRPLKRYLCKAFKK